MKPYESYKKTNIPWLDEVPSHWDIKRNSAIFYEVIDTNHPELDLLSITTNGVVKQSITGRKIRMSADNSSYKKIQIDDIGYNLMNAFIGSIGVSNYDGIISPAYAVCRFRNKELNNPKYYHYLFRTKELMQEFDNHSYGIMIERNRLYFERFKTIINIVPTLVEQDQIVRYLDWQISKINKLVQTKKRQIELLKEQKQAVINKAVTKGLDDSVPMKNSGIEWLGEVPEHWEVNRLKNGCSMINRGVTPQYTEDDKTAMVVNQATFSKGYWDISKVRYTLTSPLETRGLLNCNDVLLASTGGGVLGKVFHYSENGTYIADSHVTIIRCNDKLNSKYVYYNFSTKYDLINALLAQGSTNQTELQRDWLVAFHFPFPPHEEQQAIVDYITNITGKIDTVIKETEREIELLSEYKTSLISSVVTGKVDVRDVIVPEFEVVEDYTENKIDDEEEMEG